MCLWEKVSFMSFHSATLIAPSWSTSFFILCFKLSGNCCYLTFWIQGPVNSVLHSLTVGVSEDGYIASSLSHSYQTNWEMYAAARSLQSCLTLCDPIDGSPPSSPIPGILQARTLEWVAISFSNAWKWKVKVKSLSHVRPSATPWTAAYQAPPSMGFSRQEYQNRVPWPFPERCIDSDKWRLGGWLYCWWKVGNWCHLDRKTNGLLDVMPSR